MKKTVISFILMCLNWDVLISSVSAQTDSHKLKFLHHVNAVLSNSEAETIASIATKILTTDNGEYDVPCPVTISKNGNVDSFSKTDGIIDNAIEFNLVDRVRGNVKVVRAINWCNETGAAIIGCANVPGSSLAMVRFSPDLDGILMAHEFGHNQGLFHRLGKNNLMDKSIGPTRVSVNQHECDAFRGSASSASNGVASASNDGGNLSIDSVALIKTHYFHGFPVAEGKLIPKEDVDKIIRILQDENEKQWWPNALAALGLMNSDQSFKVITEFMENATSEDFNDSLTFRALATAPIALGYYVNVSQDQQALEYMVNAATPDRIQNNSEFQNMLAIDNENTSILSGSFVAGLSLAVTEGDGALDALQDIRDEIKLDQPSIFEQLDQSKIEYQRVKDLGLETYRSRNDDN